MEISEDFERFEPIDPFQKSLGAVWYKAVEGGAIVRMPVKSGHLNKYGIMHGGALATFIDIALALTIHRSNNASVPRVTASLNLDFISPAKADESIEAHVRLLREGSKLARVRCDVFADGRLVACGSALFSPFRAS